jgi:hypothetical protein
MCDREHLAAAETRARADQADAKERFRRWVCRLVPDARHMNVTSGLQIRQLLFSGTPNQVSSKGSLEWERVFKVLPNFLLIFSWLFKSFVAKLSRSVDKDSVLKGRTSHEHHQRAANPPAAVLRHAQSSFKQGLSGMGARLKVPPQFPEIRKMHIEDTETGELSVLDFNNLLPKKW